MTKEIFKHYKPLHEQIRIHRQSHSGTWKIISNTLGKKAHAQEQLDILQSAIKLQELVKGRINEYKVLQKYHPHPKIIQQFIDDCKLLVEESEK